MTIELLTWTRARVWCEVEECFRFAEFEIRLDDCKSAPVATASLKPAVDNQGLTPLPPILIDKTQGKHDLCFRFTRAKVDPIWAIGQIELVE